jgi:hypothetical protein
VSELSVVLGDVDHGAVRVADEEPTQSPLLISERINDFGPCRDGTIVDSVDIVHLDRHIGMNMGLHIELHDTQLYLRLFSPEEEDPIEPVSPSETDHFVVELPALVEALREDVRLDASDGHDVSLGRWLRGTFPNTGARDGGYD